MSLREPIRLVRPSELGAVHFIAMGGSSMSGLALAYHELGVPVSGCDQVDSKTLEQLHDDGITIWVGHDPAQLKDVDTVVISSAIHPDNVDGGERQDREGHALHRRGRRIRRLIPAVPHPDRGDHQCGGRSSR